MTRYLPSSVGRRWGARIAVPLAVMLAVGAGRPAVAQQSCAACHANADILGRLAPDSARATQLIVEPDHYEHSVHGALGFNCTTCHADAGDFPHNGVTPVNCGGCHAASQVQWNASIHGRLHPATGTAPATCADCHTSHDIHHVDDPGSSVYRLTQYETCATCHSNLEQMAPFGQTDVETVSSYLESVHGHGLVDKGLSVVPLCTDCHGEPGTGAHEIQQVGDSTSRVNRAHVVETCGRCHRGVSAQYARGIHGQMLAQDNPDVPTCIDCHAEHGIQRVSSEGSHVHASHVAQTCLACHDREDFNEKYGIPDARGTTFEGSFHGVALASGELTVANCESCHGAHEILPSSDSASTIHADNLVATCGSCHEGIGEGVLAGKVHVRSLREDVNLLAYGVQWFYYLIIAAIVVYGIALIALDQYRHRVVDPRSGGNHD